MYRHQFVLRPRKEKRLKRFFLLSTLSFVGLNNPAAIKQFTRVSDEGQFGL